VLIDEEPETEDKKDCLQCLAVLNIDSKFCNTCGARQYPDISKEVPDKWRLLKQAALFYSIYIIVCCIGSFIDSFDTLFWSVVFDTILAVTAIAFFVDNWAENKLLFRWPNFSILKLLGYIGIAILGSVIVHYSVTWLNITIFSKEEHFYYLFKTSVYYAFLLILIVAVLPAIFEELAFRGYLLNLLLKVADKEQAIYISAFLFAIIHLSFISLFWLIPFALFIGYIRVKENTLWYGVFFHFFFNLTACLFDLL
jgi:membrane protease YdiL (CAAX protease family)